MKKTIKEESPGTSVGNASVAMPATMKNRKFPWVVVDRRFDLKKPPKLLKSFKAFLGEK